MPHNHAPTKDALHKENWATAVAGRAPMPTREGRLPMDWITHVTLDVVPPLSWLIGLLEDLGTGRNRTSLALAIVTLSVLGTYLVMRRSRKADVAQKSVSAPQQHSEPPQRGAA